VPRSAMFSFGKKKTPAVDEAVPLPANAQLPADVTEHLLKDPKVRQSMQVAGANALADPAVQAQILAACKENFPQYAAAAKDQVGKWANDPAVQAKAKEMAGKALEYAGNAGDMFMKQIEQGPAGVRVLAFIASAASAGWAVLSLVDIFRVLGHTVLYVVAGYQLIFSLSTALFELKPEWIQTVEDKTTLPVSKYQDMLLENAKFLSWVGGRGMFYIFQGTLWLAFASFTDLVNLLLGLFLAFVGVLHVLMHCGVAPTDVATKMREGYRGLAGSSSDAA